MTTFKCKEDLKIGKIYEIVLKNGKRAIVFRDDEGIKSTAHRGKKIRNGQYDIKPCYLFLEEDIAEFTLYPDKNSNGS